MKGINVIYTIESLLKVGHSISKIARDLGVDRKTVRKYKKRIEEGNLKPIEIEKKSLLDEYKEDIGKLIEKDFSLVLIHEKLEKRGVKTSYSNVKAYAQKHFSQKEAFAPMLAAPGEEAQVDFGYVGIFDNKKTWVFCMTLSFSRYSFCKLVRDQSVETFIKCHREGFEYFGGAPKYSNPSR